MGLNGPPLAKCSTHEQFFIPLNTLHVSNYSQLYDYLDHGSFIANGKRCWALGARGKEMKLWRFRKGNAEDKKMLPWAVVQAEAKERERKNAPPPYSVVDNYDEVRILMDFITSHPDPDF